MDPLVAAGVAAAFIIISGERKKRRWWKKQHLIGGEYHGEYIMSELLLNDGSSFKDFVRLTKSDFEELLQLVAPKISKQRTNWRASVPPSTRLAIALRYLATGDSYTSLMYMFRVSKQSISLLVPEVCAAIIEVLNGYVQVPKTENEWLKIADGFEKRWNFPHCIGALDGKHVQIEAPINSRNVYYNCHGTFSIALMALADADYKVLYADVGCEGRISDGGVFKSTSFYRAMESNNLNIPKPKSLMVCPDGPKLPFVFVAGDTFALGTHLMKPFPCFYPKGSLETAYNYRLSRARRIIENVFGILSVVFRILRRPISLEPKKAEILVLACIYLYNFQRRSVQSSHTYAPPGTYDREDVDTGEIVPGTWRSELGDQGFLELKSVPRRSSEIAIQVRNAFAEYFMSDLGKVHWQDVVA